MIPSLKIGLGIIGGLAAGGAIGYYIGTTRKGRKAIGAAEDVVSSLRLPQPSYGVQLPESEEEFDFMQDLICECGAPVIDSVSDGDPLNPIIDKIRLCMAKELYPDFPWPPIPGDHPTASQLFTELGVLVRRSLATAEICPHPIPPIVGLPIPTK